MSESLAGTTAEIGEENQNMDLLINIQRRSL